uniref:Secreted RxLR effector protein 159 n=1 Tax=Plasmopara viticola TaxID=143451 RepID=RL159_PLAVT|nr:RecName: Full=Secreted RxLR effector protein 159; Flags: Precursor [Plasmopara viticola]
MRGAYYVAIAFLVAASSRTAAEFDQAEPQPAINNDILTSGGTVNEMLPKRVLRGSRDLKDKLAVYANDEQRTFDLFPNENNFSKALNPTITKTANVMRADRDDVMAKAAEQ